MGAGGVIIPPKTYFAEIRAVLEKYDVLLVADEVICGFGRTGNMWGSQTMDVRPDMLTCAKAQYLLICQFRLCSQKKYMCQSRSMQNGWDFWPRLYLLSASCLRSGCPSCTGINAGA